MHMCVCVCVGGCTCGCTCVHAHVCRCVCGCMCDEVFVSFLGSHEMRHPKWSIIIIKPPSLSELTVAEHDQMSCRGARFYDPLVLSIHPFYPTTNFIHQLYPSLNPPPPPPPPHWFYPSVNSIQQISTAQSINNNTKPASVKKDRQTNKDTDQLFSLRHTTFHRCHHVSCALPQRLPGFFCWEVTDVILVQPLAFRPRWWNHYLHQLAPFRVEPAEGLWVLSLAPGQCHLHLLYLEVQSVCHLHRDA